MEDKWIFYMKVNFGDDSIKQYHVDTRDFYCLRNTKESDKEIDIKKINKYPDHFIHTDKEVLQLLTRLFTESGGEKKWRTLTLGGDDGKRVSGGWQLKYLRIHRIDRGLIVCDREHFALNKSVLSCPVVNPY